MALLSQMVKLMLLRIVAHSMPVLQTEQAQNELASTQSSEPQVTHAGRNASATLLAYIQDHV
jgi:hypothetical protein